MLTNFGLALVLVVLNVYILSYLFRLETIGCRCAMDFRRTYAIVYLILSVVYALAMGVFTYFDARRVRASPRVYEFAGVLATLMFAAGIVYLVFGLQYIERLRAEKCLCSVSVARDVWEIVMYIHVAFLILFVLLLLMTAVAWSVLPEATRREAVRERLGAASAQEEAEAEAGKKYRRLSDLAAVDDEQKPAIVPRGRREGAARKRRALTPPN